MRGGVLVVMRTYRASIQGQEFYGCVPIRPGYEPVNDHRDAKVPFAGWRAACNSKPIRLVMHLRSPGTYRERGKGSIVAIASTPLPTFLTGCNLLFLVAPGDDFHEP